MLQLACADSFHTIKEAIEALKVGHNLLRALTLKPEPSTDRVFVVSLNRSPSAFPSLCAELGSLRKQGVISKMPQAMKLELRKKLKLDVAVANAAAVGSAVVGASSTGIVDNNDLADRLGSLEDFVREQQQQINTLRLNIQNMRDAARRRSRSPRR